MIILKQIARVIIGITGICLLGLGSWLWYLYSLDVDVDSFVSPVILLFVYGKAHTYFNLIASGVLCAAGFFLVQWAWYFKQKRPR